MIAIKKYNNTEFIDIKVGTKNYRLIEIRKNNNKTFRFWTNVGVVFEYIWEYLNNKFQNDLLIPEIDQVDILNISKNIPIEIQSTILRFNNRDSRVLIQHHQFYTHVTHQIRLNLEKYGKCWFFFDWEYFDYTIDGLGKNSKYSINNLFNQFDLNSIRVFLVRFNGDIKEVPIKEFKQTSVDDSEALKKINMKILSVILEHHDYTSGEIKKLRDQYLIEGHKSHHFKIWLQGKTDNDRAVLLGQIFNGLGRLGDINSILDRNNKTFENWVTYTSRGAKALGIIFYKPETKKYEFSDPLSMCKYFPAYQRNKAFWDEMDGKTLNRKQFYNIVFNTGNLTLDKFKQ